METMRKLACIGTDLDAAAEGVRDMNTKSCKNKRIRIRSISDNRSKESLLDFDSDKYHPIIFIQRRISIVDSDDEFSVMKNNSVHRRHALISQPYIGDIRVKRSWDTVGVRESNMRSPNISESSSSSAVLKQKNARAIETKDVVFPSSPRIMNDSVDFEETPEAITTEIVNITNELNFDVNNDDIDELMQELIRNLVK
ncbi:hypothetical protein WN51_06427 [Melipona quadrifasciata]|uniref:Uncharacterized protein n=1 Tax=Melipona quadrifasciata TaxID=166423 RepID=A0A0M9A9J7_9HYME|nr:hypothetical protein WN51_06427 [Melipona quadrifasciata]